jgi:hypothetical protein
VPASTLVGSVGQERPGWQAGQSLTLATQVCLVGVARFGREGGEPVVGPWLGTQIAGLDQCQEALEPQCAVQRFRADADRGQAATTELTVRNCQFGTDRTDVTRAPRHEPAYRLRHERVGVGARGHPAHQMRLQDGQCHLG